MKKVKKISIILLPIFILLISLFIIIKPNYKEKNINPKEYQEELETVSWELGESNNNLLKYFSDNDIDISNITKIVFFNDDQPISSEISSDLQLDLSTNEDNLVVGYLEDETLYIKIKKDNKLKLNPDSSYLFSSYIRITQGNMTWYDEIIDERKITSIEGLNLLDTSQVTNMSGMFAYMSSLTTLDLSSFDTSQVTNMSGMFEGMSSLTTLDLSSFDTSQVTNMSGMFAFMPSLTTLDLSSFDTSQVTDMTAMFASLSFEDAILVGMLDETDIEEIKAEFNLTDEMFKKMFQRSKIDTIYVSDKFDISKVENSEMMFLNAEHLIGGNGTKYNVLKIDKEYARIDKEGTPGYFTDILDKYVEGTYIKDIKVKTTVKELKEELKNIGEITILDEKNNIKEETKTENGEEKEIKVATFDKVRIKRGEETKDYTIIVTGDTTGDGVININDLTYLVSILEKQLKEETLTEKEKISSDITYDNAININDLTKMVSLLEIALKNN